MTMIHVQTPNAKSMDHAIAEAFAHFGCEPLGGPSKDGWSKTSDLQRCAYRYYLKHEAQVYIPTGAPTAPPLEIGGLFHALLALHYCRMLPEGYPGWRKNSPSPLDFLDYLRTCGAEAINVHEAARLYSAYAETYDNDDLIPVAVEMPAGIEGIHTCRYDLLAWHEGALWCVEHKCLPGSALVYTAQGLVSVKTLVEAAAPWKCAALDKQKHLVWTNADAPRPAGMQQVYELVLASGRRARLGHKHPVLTRRGWVAAEALQLSDEVAVPLHLPDLPEAKIADPMLYVLGALLADGGLTHRNCTYTKKSSKKRAFYKMCLRELGMSPAATAGDARYSNAPGKLMQRTDGVRVSTRSCVAKMVDALSMRVRSSVKQLPSLLLNLSERQIGLLLGGLFAGDGSIGTYLERRKSGQCSKKPRICYGSRSRVLCEGIAHLLQRLGITASCTSTSVSYKGERLPYHFTTVVGRVSKNRFLDLVSANAIRGPFDLTAVERCRAAIAACVQPDPRAPSIENGIWWNKVDSVLAVGVEPTFDISVPGLANFVAEGIITHNSARAMTAEVLESWWLDGEILGELYAWKLSNLSEKFGAPLAGVMINIVSKTNPPACRRLEVVVPPVVLDGFQRDRQWWAQQREHMRRTSQWPRSLHGCISRYEMCHYWSHCRDEDASILVPMSRRAA